MSTPSSKAIAPAVQASAPPAALAPNNQPPIRPQPVPRQSDPRVQQSIKDFETFISFIFSISIFGASTFAIIAGQMTDPIDIWKPDPPTFHISTVRSFLGIAWLCFVLALAVAGYSSSILVLHRQSAGGVYDEKWGKAWDRFGIVSSVVLHLLLVCAFLFLSLCLVAYVGAVGWVAVGFSSLAILFVLGLSGYQAVKS
ncbi:hypothetical protein QBC34DRAFT_413122 [Podospora aff. communis PSN243]|uniref:MARVEL domain-containing protein n=1 Tax=Podospora aff. communis PSN243 TaxID=3040156 RepID=A0AAV9GE30_9PEZI|nr:hypothetical protein QBC34DRAFT_413122 [Podospora aff. communis PSN243]